MKRLFILSLAILLALPAAAPAAQENGGLKLPPYKKVKLKNGMTLLLMEQKEVPIISFNYIIRAGSIADPAGKEGVASLTAGLLRKGTKTRSADQISAELDFIGGLLGAGATFDYTSGTAEFIKKDINKGLELLGGRVAQPDFPAGRSHQAAQAAHRRHQVEQGPGAGSDRHLLQRLPLRLAPLREAHGRRRKIARRHHARRRAEVLSRLLLAVVYRSWP